MPNIEYVCTLNVARSMGISPATLENCCEVLGVEMEGMHHALADARATYLVATKMGIFSGQDLHEINHINIWPSLDIIEKDPKTRPIYPNRQSPKKQFVNNLYLKTLFLRSRYIQSIVIRQNLNISMRLSGYWKIGISHRHKNQS